MINFPSLLALPVVGLDPNNILLGQVVNGSHQTRNDMQHNNAAATVDDPHCADAILDAVKVIDHCFANASADFSDAMKVLLRVVSLQATGGDRGRLSAFEDAMVSNRWRGIRDGIRVTELAVPVGHRRHWGLVVHSDYATVEAILNRVGAP
jgi:hypothetical protein